MCHPQSIRIVVITFALLLAVAAPVRAQVTTATLLGAVRDSSGAVVPWRDRRRNESRNRRAPRDNHGRAR